MPGENAFLSMMIHMQPLRIEAPVRNIKLPQM